MTGRYKSIEISFLQIEKQAIITYDYGNENKIVSNLESIYTKYPILDLIPNVTFRSIPDCKYLITETNNNNLYLDSSLKFFKILSYANIFKQIIDTSFLKRLKIDYTPNIPTNDPSAGGLMLLVQCFDASMTVLEPSNILDSNTWDVTAYDITWNKTLKKYAYEGNIGTQYVLLSNRVKFIDFNIMGGIP